VAGIALTVMSGTEELILANGRPRLLLAFNSCFLCATMLAVFAASPFGLTAVCLAVAGTHVVMVTVAQAGILRRLLDVSLRQLAADIVPAAVAAAAVLGAGALAEPWVAGIGSPFVRVAALAALSIGVYLLVFRVAFGSAWAEMSRTVRRVLSPSRAPTAVPPPVQESVA
ncbi:MAG: hypothetical protein ACREIV_09605, partial [Planctomycetaceae bacterium]